MTRRTKLLLGLILLVGLALRGVGVSWESFHPDERHVLSQAQHLIDKRTLAPKKMYYGSLGLYAQALLIPAAETVHGWTTDRAFTRMDQLVVARSLWVVVSALTVLATWRLARRLMHTDPGRPVPMTALLAPAFFSVCFLSIQCAHYDTVDTLTSFLALLSVTQALKALDTGRQGPRFLAAMLAGLAAATKYPGGLAAIGLVPVALAYDRPRWIRRLVFRDGMGVIVGFLLGMPFAVLKPVQFIRAAAFETHHYATGGETIFAAGPDGISWHLAYLYHTGVGPGVLGLALIGLGWGLSAWSSLEGEMPERRRLATVSIYPIALFFFVSAFKVRFDRNILPALPFLAVFAALAVHGVWTLWSRHHRLPTLALLTCVVTLALAGPFVRAVLFDWQLHQVHTRAQSNRWANRHPGARIASHGKWLAYGPEYYRKGGYDFVVMSSHSYEPVFRHPDRYPELAARYRALLAEFPVVTIFRNPWFDSDLFTPHALLNSSTANVYHGPTMIILRVPGSRWEQGGHQRPGRRRQPMKGPDIEEGDGAEGGDAGG